jgi:hypothetical protein
VPPYCAARSFHRFEAKTWRCAASWERKANWVNTIPSTPATMSWNHDEPSIANAAHATTRTPMREAKMPQ